MLFLKCSLFKMKVLMCSHKINKSALNVFNLKTYYNTVQMFGVSTIFLINTFIQ